MIKLMELTAFTDGGSHSIFSWKIHSGLLCSSALLSSRPFLHDQLPHYRSSETGTRLPLHVGLHRPQWHSKWQSIDTTISTTKYRQLHLLQTSIIVSAPPPPHSSFCPAEGNRVMIKTQLHALPKVHHFVRKADMVKCPN